MKFNNKAELDEIVLTLGVIIGSVIISVWFIFFLSNQTVKSQDIAFSSLNKFSANYELLLLSDEARMEGIQIIGIPNSIISVNNNNVCIEAENTIKTCKQIISGTINYKNNFTLEKINFFKFIKQEDGTIIIEKQY